jgi:hypothetical protein
LLFTSVVFTISPSFGQALISFPVAPGVTLGQLKDYVLAPRISGTITLLRFVYLASIPRATKLALW